jgi:hypothetical protein
VAIGIEGAFTESEVPVTLAARLQAVEEFTLNPQGNPQLRGQSYYTNDEFEVWAECVREHSRMGFPFTEADLKCMMQAGVRDQLQKDFEAGLINEFVDKERHAGGDIPDFGSCFISA